jgi:hypothetical protein
MSEIDLTLNLDDNDLKNLPHGKLDVKKKKLKKNL